MAENAENPRPATTSKVYVWDLPTRLFHWLLVGSVTTSLAAGELGYMDIHVISGHVVLALILFRLGWGFIGGRHARFTDFVRGPATVLAYARELVTGKHRWHAGHNPMGGWSVLALLFVLAVQAGTGLYANDDILTEGPLASTVTKSLSNTLTYVHHLSSKALYTLIVLHLAAITFYAVKGDDLVRAMIVGAKRGGSNVAQASGVRGSWLTAAVLAAIAAVIAYGIKTY